MPAKLKIFYLHNIDGRRCAMIAAASKAEVRTVVRLAASEIAEATHSEDAQEMARAEPGTLFVAQIHGHPKVWQRDGRKIAR